MFMNSRHRHPWIWRPGSPCNFLISQGMSLRLISSPHCSPPPPAPTLPQYFKTTADGSFMAGSCSASEPVWALNMRNVDLILRRYWKRRIRGQVYSIALCKTHYGCLSIISANLMRIMAFKIKESTRISLMDYQLRASSNRGHTSMNWLVSGTSHQSLDWGWLLVPNSKLHHFQNAEDKWNLEMKIHKYEMKDDWESET